MTYDKHHADLQKMLTEFERVTGTGSMKTANQAMIKIIRSLVAMVETLVADKTTSSSPTKENIHSSIIIPKITRIMPPISTGCGGACEGNCKCNPPAPMPIIEEAVPVVLPVLLESVPESVPESVVIDDHVESVTETETTTPETTVEAIEEAHVTEVAGDAEVASEDAPKPAKKAKKLSV